MVLKELCALRGVSGDEGRVRDYIRAHAEKYAEVRVDRMGNLFAFKRGTGENRRHVVLAAHMDEVGMLVKGINDNGLINYSTVGYIDSKLVVSKPVRIGDDEVPGVIGAKAIHLQTPDDRKKLLSHDQLYIDIGAKDKASAEKLVSPGDSITYDSRWTEFGNGLVKARALDDRIGCMILMSLLEGEYPCDVTCVFTVQEEIGARGAVGAAYSIESDAAIILDATTANDLGDIEEWRKICRVGSGVVISFMDGSAISSVPLYSKLKSLADENDISWQLKQAVAGGTDAPAFQVKAGARPVCILSAPCRYVHSPSCVAAFSDIDAQYRLAEAFLLAGGEF